MAAPPRTKNLKVEDVQDPETLTRNLNQFLGPTHQALSGGLTFGENLKAQWHETQPLYAEDDWQPVTLVDGTTTVQAAAACKSPDGTVRLRGSLLRADTAPQNLATLPEGYGPASESIYATSATGAFGEVTVHPHGTLEATAGTLTGYVSLDGLTWQAADRTPIPPACFPYDFKSKYPDRPKAVVLADWTEDSPTRQPRAALGIPDWEFVFKNNSEPYIRINNVPGMIPGRKYRLTFLVVAG